MDISNQPVARTALQRLLQNYSVEVTAGDRDSLNKAAELLRPGTEVFVAWPPGGETGRQIATCVRLHQAGMTPVPHVVARNLADEAALDDFLGRLTREAGVDRALALGGDRANPEGVFDSSLQLIKTGLFQKHGITRIAVACYPEGHPRIAETALEEARAEKFRLAGAMGLEISLVGQFCFDAKPVIALAEHMRAQGVTAPFRVGVAGPAERGKLIKYALICGVGPSLRALRERNNLIRNFLFGSETPKAILTKVAAAQESNPSLGMSGVHFFTFGDLAKSVEWAENQLNG